MELVTFYLATYPSTGYVLGLVVSVRVPYCVSRIATAIGLS